MTTLETARVREQLRSIQFIWFFRTLEITLAKLVKDSLSLPDSTEVIRKHL
ncbi:hypothetical protein Thiowin_00479 [Thiorhodovibrio winogradskyi]|uniref:Uncharacterized protein n=1 Tax=Thiorhodovibrio winogradskyi TaxID=77007 RepID=A0ABZ0S360_9GAMM|nr:hypothetical protein [Thiorhodovibrio winogradskyi]